MERAQGPSGRKDILLWVFAAFFVAAIALFLFWSQPIFLRVAGVKATLLAQAARLRGAPPREAAAGVGRLLKGFLDASRHTSRVDVVVREATASRLAFSLVLPWAESSPKKQKGRAGAVARLAVQMLDSAGARDVAVAVEVRRRGRDQKKILPVGRILYDPKTRRLAWRDKTR